MQGIRWVLFFVIDDQALQFKIWTEKPRQYLRLILLGDVLGSRVFLINLQVLLDLLDGLLLEVADELLLHFQ